jgi:7-carboxy-7-deazaguanine synthase
LTVLPCGNPTLPVPVIMRGNAAADIVEIFSSIQGEGMLVGCRQVFLRFHGCNLSCAYCDTRETHNNPVAEYCRLEKAPGKRDFAPLRNPVTIQRVKEILVHWVTACPGAHHSISLTGGEPLMHDATLMEWLPVVRDILPVYLETNGTRHVALSRCISFLDHISMDVKLPSTSGIEGLWDEHREFLIIASRKNVFVKIVVSDATQSWEVMKTRDLIFSIDRSIPLVIQPMTGISGDVAVSSSTLLEFQEIAGSRLQEVRVIPQTHRFLRML